MPSGSISTGTVRVAVELSRNALAAVNTGTLFVLDRFLPRDADGVLLCLDVEIAFADSWKFNDGHKAALTLLEDVDRREGTRPGRCVPKPIACLTGFESTLQSQQCGERVAVHHAHGSLPSNRTCSLRAGRSADRPAFDLGRGLALSSPDC